MAESFNSLVNKATSSSSNFDSYEVDTSDKQIVMKLEIGAPGQKSLSRVKIDTTSLAKDVNGEINNLKVGTNKSVRGRFLLVETVVTDILGGTDDTFIKFTLTGGPTGKYVCELSKTVSQAGDSIFYEIEIFFFG